MIPKFRNVKSPAMTRVAECNKLETGVGPSMASGSHKKVVTCTDFRINASRKKRFRIEKLSVVRDEIAVTINKKTSPIRLNPIAENAEEIVRVREYHVEISMKLTRPTISHDTKRRNVPEEFNTNQTASRNANKRRTKPDHWESNSRYAENPHKPSKDAKITQTRKFQTDVSCNNVEKSRLAYTDDEIKLQTAT